MGRTNGSGSVNELTRPQFKTYFNQVTPENAGKWGSAAGTTRTAAMRWDNLDAAYTFAQTSGFPFNFHVLVWGNQQPTWMAALPAEEQLAEIKKWFAAVADRYPDIEWLQVVNEPLHDPPDCTHSANQGNNCNSSGNYARALGGANGTDGTGWDWILNAFRLAKQYFPNTKLMLNDYSITNSNTATTQYLQIIEILKRENLIDVVGEQGHAFSTTGDMAVHKGNLDRLQATGLPIQITELDIDGVAAGGVPGDEVQLRDYRRIVPVFWEHPGVEGITVWGWRQPNHWRNAQNAPIVLSDDTPKPAALWLHDYVRGIAPPFRRTSGSRSTTSMPRSGRSRPRTGPRGSAGPTCARSPGASPAVTAWGSSRSCRVRANCGSPTRGSSTSSGTYTLRVRVSDGFHESEEVEVAVVTGDLSNVADAAVGGTVPATLALTMGAPASFGSFTPGVEKEYTASTTATVTSTVGNAALSVSEATLANGAFHLAQPVATTPEKTSWSGPASNDTFAIAFKQSVGRTEPLRTGTYSATVTVTLSTTTP